MSKQISKPFTKLQLELATQVRNAHKAHNLPLDIKQAFDNAICLVGNACTNGLKRVVDSVDDFVVDSVLEVTEQPQRMLVTDNGFLVWFTDTNEVPV